MPGYVDGFVLPMPKKNLASYKRIAQKASKVWKDHGALQYFECAGEDLDVKFGLPFPKGIKTKKGETVVFAWILYKSRKHRDAVNKKVMSDKRIASMGTQPMPFDCNRMIYGGFDVLVKA
jgi:uncharacterized protein YbaA (DUF1428 family)